MPVFYKKYSRIQVNTSLLPTILPTITTDHRKRKTAPFGAACKGHLCPWQISICVPGTGRCTPSDSVRNSRLRVPGSYTCRSSDCGTWRRNGRRAFLRRCSHPPLLPRPSWRGRLRLISARDTVCRRVPRPAVIFHHRNPPAGQFSSGGFSSGSM